MNPDNWVGMMLECLVWRGYDRLLGEDSFLYFMERVRPSACQGCTPHLARDSLPHIRSKRTTDGAEEAT